MADEASLKVGDWLGMRPTVIHEASQQAEDLANIRETDPIYLKERILRFAKHAALLQVGADPLQRSSCGR